MPLSAFCRSLLRRFGIVAVRSHHAAVRHIDFPPRSMLDLVLLHVFPDLKCLHFIQVGANDGVLEDPIRNKVLECEWTGLFVEPLPHLFDQLRKNYKGRPGLEFLNAAVDVSSEGRTIHYVRLGLSAPTWTQGLATFDLSQLQKSTQKMGIPEADIVHQNIRTVTWQQLLSAFGSKPCDVLVLDTEGYDFTLLRAAPLHSWRPKVIHFEHSCSNSADRLSLYGELIGLGYEIASEGQDTTAWLRNQEARS